MQAVCPQRSNPYIVGKPVEGKTLYGRDDIFEFVFDTLVASKQNAVVLYGQRRAGKTSILRELPNRLPEEKFHVTIFDLSGRAKLSLPEVLHNLASTITESLDIRLPEPPDFETDRDCFRKQFLPTVWQKLGERSLLLLFDEFELPSESENETIRDRAEREFYPYMRRLLDEEKRLSFVFVVGRRIDDLNQWVKRVFKEAQYKKIGLLKREEAVALITKPAAGVLSYRPEAIRAILELSSGHPYFTQLLCFELFNHAQKQGMSTVSDRDVSAVVDRALESGKPALVWLWDAISSSGQIYLAAAAHVRERQGQANDKTIQEALEQFRLRPGPGWNSVPRELAEWDLLRDDTPDVQFVVKLVELWVRTSHTLRDIKADMMQEGDDEFKKARALAQNGESALAVKAFRDLLTTNPNHLAAQLALAQALADRHEIKEAVDAFEAAFWLDQDVGRDGLIDSRLALAQDLEEKGQFVEAAVHYRRVLELKPDEYRVQEKLRVWYDQGRKAAATGDWEKAAHLLERITDVDKTYKDAHQRRDNAYEQRKLAAQAKESEVPAEAPYEPPAPAPPRARRRSSSSPGVIIALFALAVSLWGGYLWQRGSLPSISIPTQVIAFLYRTPTPTGTAEAMVSPTQALTLSPAAVPTETPTASPMVESTHTPTGELPPAPTNTRTVAPTNEPTSTPSRTPTATPTPGPTLTPASTPTPVLVTIIVVVTPTPSPTPTLPSYPQPQLITPPALDLTSGAGRFSGRSSQPRLEWQAISDLGPNDFYVVSVSFPGAAGTVFRGAAIKEPFWVVDQSLYDEVAGSQRDFIWWVNVSHFEGSRENAQGQLEPVGDGVEVSPPSEMRVFRWD